MAEQYKRNPNTKCIVCNKPTYKRPKEIQKNHGRVFCGTACYGISCRNENPCIICGTLILASANKKTCSRSCANRHRAGIQYKINRLKDKVKSQQALKIRLLNDRGKNCERCTFNKYEILQVHHKNKNRNNNSMNNLELICPNCHAEEHYLKNNYTKNTR